MAMYGPGGDIAKHDLRRWTASDMLQWGGEAGGLRVKARDGKTTFDHNLYDAAEHRRFRADMGRGQGSAGGFLADKTFVDNLELALHNFSVIRQLAQIRRPARGPRLRIPTLDLSTLRGGIVNVKTPAVQTDLTFNAAEFDESIFTTPLLVFSRALAQDVSTFVADVGRVVGQILARLQNNVFTLGTGGQGTEGLVQAAPVGKTTASATAIAGDELWALVTSIPGPYRAMPTSCWMMHSTIMAYVLSLKDGMGQYIWKMASLDQWPIVCNDDMASSLTASAVPILFGDMGQFVVSDFGETRIQFLQEKYAETDSVGVIGFLPSDGALLPVNAVKSLQMAAS